MLRTDAESHKLGKHAGVIGVFQSLRQQEAPSAVHALIVDDHSIVAQALSNLFKLRFDVDCTLALSTSSAITLAKQQPFNIALLDLELSDGNGLEVAEVLAVEQPDCAILIVSGHADTLYCPRNLKPRIRAVINKSQAFAELETVLQGFIKTHPADLHKGDHLTDLTSREADVYRLLGEGMSCKQISAALNLTVRTVETHRKHIASKLGSSGAELVHKATLDQLRRRLDDDLKTSTS